MAFMPFTNSFYNVFRPAKVPSTMLISSLLISVVGTDTYAVINGVPGVLRSSVHGFGSNHYGKNWRA